MQKRFELNQLDLLPKNSGIYKFFDASGKLMYIGKALNLFSRVNSYFKSGVENRPHILPMISKIAYVKVIETANDVEALVLESALIKKYQPRYNIEEKDDKSFAWIYISTQDQFPTIRIVRTMSKDEFKQGRLFGPYPSGSAVRQLFKYIRKLHPFCTCTKPRKECLYFHLKLCPGPHQGYITPEDYRKEIDGIIKFLQGKRKRYIGDLERQMKDYSKEMNFEKAAQLRDRIQDLHHLGNRLNFTYFDTESEFIQKREKMFEGQLENLATLLKNNERIRRIECYDISNISGELAYGSMVVSIDGEPTPAKYRVFKIRNKSTPDDFEMLKETLKRRLKYINQDNVDESLGERPDLILIDGGKGQLSKLTKLIPVDIKVMGISKGRRFKRQGGKKRDEFWIRRGPISLPIKLTESDGARILSNIRDEAHRFALKHHRNARKLNQKKSIFDEVKGIGPSRRRELIKAFGSLSGVREASKEELLKILKSEKVVEELMSKIKTEK